MLAKVPQCRVRSTFGPALFNCYHTCFYIRHHSSCRLLPTQLSDSPGYRQGWMARDPSRGWGESETIRPPLTNTNAPSPRISPCKSQRQLCPQPGPDRVRVETSGLAFPRLRKRFPRRCRQQCALSSFRAGSRSRKGLRTKCRLPVIHVRTFRHSAVGIAVYPVAMLLAIYVRAFQHGAIGVALDPVAVPLTSRVVFVCYRGTGSGYPVRRKTPSFRAGIQGASHLTRFPCHTLLPGILPDDVQRRAAARGGEA